MEKSNRVAGIDLARALAIIFMILSHVQLYFRQDVFMDWEAGSYATFFDRLADDFLASDMAAPVFMFVMGMCMLHSHRSAAGDWMKRGGKLLLQAVFLTVVIKSGIISCGRWLLMTPEEVPQDTWVHDLLLHGDILNFAGLAFLVFALMKWLRFGHRAMLMLTGVLYIAGTVVVTTVGTESIPWPGSAVVGWFCGSDALSCFPLTLWLIYPVAGYILADALRKSADPGRLLRRVGLIGLAVFVAASVISRPGWFFGFPLVKTYAGGVLTFYHQHPVVLLRCLGLVLFELWVCEWLARRLPEGVMAQCRRWSKNVNAMYILSWALIIFTAEFLLHERNDMPISAWVTGAVVIFVVTDACVTLWKRFSPFGRKRVSA